MIKINCDAIVKHGKCAFGCIVRDDSRLILECFGNFIPSSSILAAEMAAIREACIFCSKAGIKDIIIEFDNLLAINWCKYLNYPPPWKCKCLVEDVLNMSSSLNVSFEFTRREGNVAAHRLANFVFRFSPIREASEVPSSFLSSLCIVPVG